MASFNTVYETNVWNVSTKKNSFAPP